MGADLVLGFLPSFEFTKERCELACKEIDALPVTDLVNYVSETSNVHFWGHKESGDLDEESLADAIEHFTGDDLDVNEETFVRLVKEDMKSLFKEDFDLEAHRDVVEFQYGDASYAVLLSGGMTWGDDPVNSELNCLQCLPYPLHSLFVEWAEDDWAERTKAYESAAAKAKSRGT